MYVRRVRTKEGYVWPLLDARVGGGNTVVESAVLRKLMRNVSEKLALMALSLIIS